MSAKTCTKCGALYPDASASFHRHAGRPDGLQAQCKVCVLAARREYYQHNAPAILARQAAVMAAKRAAAPISYRDTEAARKRRRFAEKIEAARLLIKRD